MTAGTKILILAAILCHGTASPPAAAQNPTAEEVIARCSETLGGKEAWRAIHSLEISGVQSSFSHQRPFTLRRLRPDYYRLDQSEGIRPMTVAYDGERGWWQREILVASRGNWELPTSEVYTRAFRGDAEFEMPCLRHGEEGYEIEFLGRGELDAESFFRLRATLAGGAVENWYLDTESFLPVARVSTGAYWRFPAEQRTFFDDYREVDGVRIPHFVEIETGNLHRTMTVERVQVNPQLDPGIFSLPLPGGMEALQQLAGRWQVQVRSRENAQAPWEQSTATSVIRRHSAGSLLEEDVHYAAAMGFPTARKRWFSYDRFRDLYRVVTFDNFTSHLDVLEGTLQDGELTISNLPTGTSWSVYGTTYHTRERLLDLTQDSFKLVRETSTDAGVTWIIEEELDYSRAGED